MEHPMSKRLLKNGASDHDVPWIVEELDRMYKIERAASKASACVKFSCADPQKPGHIRDKPYAWLHNNDDIATRRFQYLRDILSGISPPDRPQTLPDHIDSSAYLDQ